MTEVDSWVNGYELHRTDGANHDYVMSIKNICLYFRPHSTHALINKHRLSCSLLTIFALSNEALPESGDQALALASAALDVDKNEKRKS